MVRWTDDKGHMIWHHTTLGRSQMMTMANTPVLREKQTYSDAFQSVIHCRKWSPYTQLFCCRNWKFLSMVLNEKNAFISLLEVQFIIHHYNLCEISLPTIYNVTCFSSATSKLHLFESFITVKNCMNFMSVS